MLGRDVTADNITKITKILDAFSILVRIFRFDHLVSVFCETLIDRFLVIRIASEKYLTINAKHSSLCLYA